MNNRNSPEKDFEGIENKGSKMLINNKLYRGILILFALSWPSAAALAMPVSNLIDALKAGDTVLATELLGQGDVLHARTASGATPLHAAAAFGYPETVRMLLEAGANAGERGPNGNTPLIYAAQENHAEVVRMLLRAGADFRARNDFGATAAGLARGRGHREVAAEIGAAAQTGGADSSVRNWLEGAVLLAVAGAVVIVSKLFRTYFGWRTS
jgi:ankyrin repeat protein